MDRFATKLFIVGAGLGLLFAGGRWVIAEPAAGALTWLAGVAVLGWALSLFGGGGVRHA